MIAAIIRSALVDEPRFRQACAERGLKKPQLALEAMGKIGLKKPEQPDFTASARIGSPALLVTSEPGHPIRLLGPPPQAQVCVI
jgi:hypothetical protein